MYSNPSGASFISRLGLDLQNPGEIRGLCFSGSPRGQSKRGRQGRSKARSCRRQGWMTRVVVSHVLVRRSIVNHPQGHEVARSSELARGVCSPRCPLVESMYGTRTTGRHVCCRGPWDASTVLGSFVRLQARLCHMPSIPLRQWCRCRGVPILPGTGRRRSASSAGVPRCARLR